MDVTELDAFLDSIQTCDQDRPTRLTLRVSTAFSRLQAERWGCCSAVLRREAGILLALPSDLLPDELLTDGVTQPEILNELPIGMSGLIDAPLTGSRGPLRTTVRVVLIDVSLVSGEQLLCGLARLGPTFERAGGARL